MNKKLNRVNKIIEILKEKNGATVKELADIFNVSEMTIRRDLKVLNSNNIINNIYGAAIYNPANNINKLDNYYDIEDASSKNGYEKNIIGRTAASLINNDDIIIIDTGSTTEKLAENISDDLHITVLTYNTNILNKLISKKNINLIFAGGYFHPNTEMFESAEGISLIKKTRATKVFVSASGIHESLGVTCSNSYEVATKNAIIDSSLEKILLADSNKFDKVKSSYFSELNSFDTIITDKNISSNWKEIINSLGIKLIIAE